MRIVWTRMWAGRLLALLLVAGTVILPAILRPTPPSHADSTGFIAYTTDRVADQFDLFRIAADGTDDRRLTVNLFADEIDPDWTPDGSRIAFVSNQYGSPDIIFMNSDGTDHRRMIINSLRREVDRTGHRMGRESLSRGISRGASSISGSRICGAALFAR